MKAMMSDLLIKILNDKESAKEFQKAITSSEKTFKAFGNEYKITFVKPPL